MILLSTSFTVRMNAEPDYIELGEWFENLITTFFDLHVERHEDYLDAWIITITYPIEQGCDYAKRISEYINFN